MFKGKDRPAGDGGLRGRKELILREEATGFLYNCSFRLADKSPHEAVPMGQSP